MYLEYYLKELGYPNIPEYLTKYLSAPSLIRLKKVGYFCGMDYASKDVYNFSEYISRYDHSLNVALITYNLTQDKLATLAGLFHDIATPCFSHVIDYMNGDYLNQESTEEYTEKILRCDKYLNKCLIKDNINIEDIINFKKYTIVDNDRPKVCADRIDGVILTGFGWSKSVTLEDIHRIVADMCIVKNDIDEYEIGFTNINTINRIIDISYKNDLKCHSKEDNYMMDFLSKITKYAIKKGYIKYDDLYKLNEDELFYILKNNTDDFLKGLIYNFENIKCKDIPVIDLPKIKTRNINPIMKMS